LDRAKPSVLQPGGAVLERLEPTERELRELALQETDPARAGRFAPIVRGPVFAVLALAVVGVAALPGILRRLLTPPAQGDDT
jgi:hypothetical protein